jgi:UDP-N-acetyl-D-mannosaminuronate dehydrogenase
MPLNSHAKAVRGSKILVLGIAYKRDIDDIRESPALDVMAVLAQKGGHVSYHDPFAHHLAARDWPGATDLSSCADDRRHPGGGRLRRDHHRP